MSLLSVATTLLRPLLLPVAVLSERLANRFYIVLALLMALLFSWAISGDRMAGMKYQAYDLIMKNRFHTPAADPEVVILDVDEASLAALAGEMGRWPWARSLWAETVEALARQQPKAIVFDITFSDPDVNNPLADSYLHEVAAAHPETFFTMIRLNPDNDRLSELKLAGLAGVERSDAAASPDATIAMVVPYFFEVLGGRRMGTNNLYPDDDGIVRRYHVYRDNHGYRLFSLSANVAIAGGAPVPASPDITLNWRGQPGAYQAIPFHQFYTDMQRGERQRPADEFRDKVVIIGSTAPSLFDIKPTPVAKIHPGVEVLATALDNVKNGDYLREVPKGLQVAVTLAIIALLAAAFVYNFDTHLLNTLFTTVQTGFLATSYLVLNYSTLFIDLTAPFTAGLIFFTVARLYGTILVMRRNGHFLFSTALDAGHSTLVVLAEVRFAAADKAMRGKQRRLLERQAGLSRYGVAVPGLFTPAPLLHAIYRDRLTLYWLVPLDKGAQAAADLLQLLVRVVPQLEQSGGQATLALHAQQIEIDSHEGQWRDSATTLLPAVMNAAASAATPITLSAEFRRIVTPLLPATLPQPLREQGFILEEPTS